MTSLRAWRMFPSLPQPVSQHPADHCFARPLPLPLRSRRAAHLSFASYSGAARCRRCGLLQAAAPGSTCRNARCKRRAPRMTTKSCLWANMRLVVQAAARAAFCGRGSNPRPRAFAPAGRACAPCSAGVSTARSSTRRCVLARLAPSAATARSALRTRPAVSQRLSRPQPDARPRRAQLGRMRDEFEKYRGVVRRPARCWLLPRQGLLLEVCALTLLRFLRPTRRRWRGCSPAARRGLRSTATRTSTPVRPPAERA